MLALWVFDPLTLLYVHHFQWDFFYNLLVSGYDSLFIYLFIYFAFSLVWFFLAYLGKYSWSCLTLHDHIHCSPPVSSFHGIVLARIVECVLISFSWGSSWPRDKTHASHIANGSLYHLSHLQFWMITFLGRVFMVVYIYFFLFCNQLFKYIILVLSDLWSLGWESNRKSLGMFLVHK